MQYPCITLAQALTNNTTHKEELVAPTGMKLFDEKGMTLIDSSRLEEIKKVIAQAISELPEKEKMVIVLYYHEDLTFREIGEVLEVSESRISQLHTRANLRLRAKLTNLRRGII